MLDFSAPENGELVVKRTIEHFGRLDVLVNNAGSMGLTSPEDPDSYDLYKQLTAVNMDAMVRATLAAVAELKRNRGNLLFVSSIASQKAFTKAYAYCMTKAAMTSFAKCVAHDLAPHVRVNVVSPGPVKTNILGRMGMSEENASEQWSTYTPPLGRIGQSEEIAEAICFLISDRASFIHGHELFIDGGLLI